MILFNGLQAAQELERSVAERVKAKDQPLKIASVLFAEDQGSVLYTRLKQEAAGRVGIGYKVKTFSMNDALDEIVAHVQTCNLDPTITGIIIQKPGKGRWQEVTGSQEFNGWWQHLISQLDETKDVDGLHPSTLAAIKNNTWKEQGRVLPATAKAVLNIFERHQLLGPQPKIIILGKSDILGQPLFYELQNLKQNVEMIGSKELNERVEQKKCLFDAGVIVSATGRHHLLTGDLVTAGVAVIDVGEPKPDVEFASVSQKAGFMTPVPGGVGPMTVSCLLENAVELVLH
jgi:methylenetetrahydrofolate dehydrogenase (NADP+)/methenyltetrahydrofolate cyclohydrolase